jgi:enoyl-CoA hydratase/carnithine racemase
MTGLVLTEQQDRVLTITLNRPQQKNAVDHAVAVQLTAALDRLDADPDVSAGVLTGAGGTFCAGMDLKAFARGELPVLDGRGFGGLTRATVRKPLVAAVEGWALGGGFELALGCDLIVAASDARFGTPEVTHGLVPSEGGLLRLPRRIPYHVALRVLLTGDPLSAAEASRYGLVDELTAPGAALERARALAARIARNAPLALAAVKQVLRATQGLDDRAAFERQDQMIAGLLSSDDVREGAQAFAEKRAPVWQGR